MTSLQQIKIKASLTNLKIIVPMFTIIKFNLFDCL